MRLPDKLLALWLFAVLAAVYAWLCLRPARPGLPRILLAIPIVLGCFTTPLLLDPHAGGAEAILVTPLGGILSLAAFKVVAYALQRGPLALPALSPFSFGLIMVAPIIPADVFAVSGGAKVPGGVRTAWQLLGDYVKEGLGALVVTAILLANPHMHWFPRHWLYTLNACLFLGAIFDVIAATCTVLLGRPVAPAFNRPWLSESFADFWARRWNLTTTYMMRCLIYQPVMEGRLVAPPAGGPAQGAQGGAQPPQAPSSQPQLRKRTGVAEEPEEGAVGGGQATTAAAAPPSGPNRPRASKLRRFMALQATFMWSGVWHIMVFWYNTRVVSARWALFFIVQAPIVFAELLLSRAWAALHLPTLPRPLRIVLTNAALIAIAGPLFFGPTDDAGFAARGLVAGVPVLLRLSAPLPAVRDAIASGAAHWAAAC